jgi:succinate dehydrogenase / fumarate reductase flavoprotein subunit
MEFVQFHPTGIYGAGMLITKAARRGRLPHQRQRRALHGALRAAPRTWLRDVVSRSMTIEIREARRRPREGPHLPAPIISILDPAERLPGITESARIFAGVDLRRQPIPVAPTVHYNMGRHPHQLSRRGADAQRWQPRHDHPGSAGCRRGRPRSVHGANRLGSNSLTDLVVFGRAGLRCGDGRAGRRHAAAAEGCRRAGPVPSDRVRHANGSTPTSALRLQMQKAMGATAPCSARAGARRRRR